MFALSIAITSSAIETMKLALTKSLPDVKSSHRCEALARGFGYRTYASLLADGRSEQPSFASAVGTEFVTYLAQHDFNIDATPFFRAAAMAALRAVHDQQPTLTGFGFGIGPRERTNEGRWENASEYAARLEEGRAELLTDYATSPFLASLALLGRVERTRTVRPGTSSYKLKHIAENFRCSFPSGEELGTVYVPNGVFIAAAIYAGLQLRIHRDEKGREAMNADFNISRRSIDDLDCEIRPDGGAATRRRAKERAKSRSRFAYGFA